MGARLEAGLVVFALGIAIGACQRSTTAGGDDNYGCPDDDPFCEHECVNDYFDDLEACESSCAEDQHCEEDGYTGCWNCVYGDPPPPPSDLPSDLPEPPADLPESPAGCASGPGLVERDLGWASVGEASALHMTNAVDDARAELFVASVFGIHMLTPETMSESMAPWLDPNTHATSLGSHVPTPGATPGIVAGDESAMTLVRGALVDGELVLVDETPLPRAPKLLVAFNEDLDDAEELYVSDLLGTITLELGDQVTLSGTSDQVPATGDVNGDGHLDLIWREAQGCYGMVYFWGPLDLDPLELMNVGAAAGTECSMFTGDLLAAQGEEVLGLASGGDAVLTLWRSDGAREVYDSGPSSEANIGEVVHLGERTLLLVAGGGESAWSWSSDGATLDCIEATEEPLWAEAMVAGDVDGDGDDELAILDQGTLRLFDVVP